MIACVERFDQVNENDKRFLVMFSTELNCCFEGEDGVGANFLLEASALFLDSFVSDVGIHASRYDCG